MAARREKKKDPTPAERFVVLFRHGIAEDPTENKPDHERSLTRQGHRQMKENGRGLARFFPKAELILSSPLIRAVQTALWISKGYNQKVAVQTIDALTPGASPADLRKVLDELDTRMLILVGHEPNLTANAVALARLSGPEMLELRKGGCYGVRITDGAGQLEWLLTPRILKKLA